MSNPGLLCNSSSSPMESVALLPLNWRTLGTVMLGFITRRMQLPTVTDNASSPQPCCLAPPQTYGQANSGYLIEKLYQAWRDASDAHLRRQQLDALTRVFTPLIRATIRQYQDNYLTMADLQQEAFLGLHAALQTYDPRRGVALAGFVRWRIVGAVLDARRKWRHQSCDYPREFLTAREVENEMFRSPAHTAADTVEFEDLFTVLTRGLSTREKLILRLYILEEKTCRQIGKLIGLHHARVGQIYRNVIARLGDNPRARQLLAAGP